MKQRKSSNHPWDGRATLQNKSQHSQSVDFGNSMQMSFLFGSAANLPPRPSKQQLRSIVDSYFQVKDQSADKKHNSSSFVTQYDKSSSSGIGRGLPMLNDSKRIFKRGVRQSLPHLETIYTANHKSDIQSSNMTDTAKQEQFKQSRYKF